jgi:hypothetical protein
MFVNPAAPRSVESLRAKCNDGIVRPPAASVIPAQATASASPPSSVPVAAAAVERLQEQLLAEKSAALKSQTEAAVAAIRYRAKARRKLKAMTQVNQQLERDKVQLEQEEERMSRLIGQLTQDKVQLHRQLGELRVEKSINAVPQLQATLRQKDAGLAQARQLLAEVAAEAAEEAQRSRHKLESVRLQMNQMEEEVKQQKSAAVTAAADAVQARRQLEAQTKVNQQLQRDQVHWNQGMERLRLSTARMTQEKLLVEQANTQLQGQLDERTAELVTARGQIAAAASSHRQTRKVGCHC